jgi:hypothetical protein
MSSGGELLLSFVFLHLVVIATFIVILFSEYSTHGKDRNITEDRDVTNAILFRKTRTSDRQRVRIETLIFSQKSIFPAAPGFEH